MEKNSIITTEDKMILYYKDNPKCTFIDLLDKFKIKEITAKTFLNRVKNGHIQLEKIEEENKLNLE